MVHKHCLHAFNFVVKARFDDLVAITGSVARSPLPSTLLPRASTHAALDLCVGLGVPRGVFICACAIPRPALLRLTSRVRPPPPLSACVRVPPRPLVLQVRVWTPPR